MKALIVEDTGLIRGLFRTLDPVPGEGERLVEVPDGHTMCEADGLTAITSYWWNAAVGAFELLPPAEPTVEEVIAERVATLEKHYDAVAQTRRYDNRYTCALRAGYPGPFRAEGLAFAQWMDGCNALGYAIINECLAGTRPIPSNEELIAELPQITWP